MPGSLPGADGASVGFRQPLLAAGHHRCFDPLGLGVRFLMRPNHREEAVHQPHWFFLQNFPTVLTTVRCGHNPDARPDDGR